jgi:hypothetical protein
VRLALALALMLVACFDRGREVQTIPQSDTWSLCACRSACGDAGYRWDQTTRDDQPKSGWCYCGVKP